ncbi:MAG: extracellular solute-binding protein [Kineosporiaceae bacterium]
MRHLPRSVRLAVPAAVAGALVLAACGGGGDEPAEEAGGGATTGVTIDVLIAASEDAEREFAEESAELWSEETGNTANIRVAQDIQQDLQQGFAGGEPPDAFYVDANNFADLAEAGNLAPYGDQIEDADDFYESLRDTFTYEEQLYCIPKDFSTLALQINNEAWEAAGLTDDDIPTTWEELETVAAALTTGNQVGMTFTQDDPRNRLGAFLIQAGGWWVNEDGTEPTANTPENVEALTFIKGLLESGSAAYPAALDAGWGGEAFGTGRTAMAMEGPWIRGAMRTDYPDLDYRVIELPEGPAGQGTLIFTQCWGVAADSDTQAAAVDFIRFITTEERQLAAAEGFGVIPSRESAREGYLDLFPDNEAFINGAEYGRGPIIATGLQPVLLDLDTQLQNLATGDPEQILESFDTNAAPVLGQ